MVWRTVRTCQEPVAKAGHQVALAPALNSLALRPGRACEQPRGAVPGSAPPMPPSAEPRATGQPAAPAATLGSRAAALAPFRCPVARRLPAAPPAVRYRDGGPRCPDRLRCCSFSCVAALVMDEALCVSPFELLALACSDRLLRAAAVGGGRRRRCLAAFSVRLKAGSLVAAIEEGDLDAVRYWVEVKGISAVKTLSPTTSRLLKRYRQVLPVVLAARYQELAIVEYLLQRCRREGLQAQDFQLLLDAALCEAVTTALLAACPGDRALGVLAAVLSGYAPACTNGRNEALGKLLRLDADLSSRLPSSALRPRRHAVRELVSLVARGCSPVSLSRRQLQSLRALLMESEP